VLGQLHHPLLRWLSVEIKEGVKEGLTEPRDLIKDDPEQTKTVVLCINHSELVSQVLHFVLHSKKTISDH
jgi:hypothetical protein